VNPQQEEALMQVSKRSAIGLLSAATLAGSAIGGMSAFGHDDHGKHRGQTLFNATLAPTVLSDPTIHGVARGGVPWQLDSGRARLRAGGRLTVGVRGLVIPGNGTPGPVTTISASLYCGADTIAAATTAPVPISRDGDARIDQVVGLPAKCLGPVVLVNPNGNAAAYIAASGFGR
jgi:hypothetical protein